MRLTRRRFVGAAGAAAGAVLSRKMAGAFPAVRAPGPARTYKACVIGSTGRGGYGHGLDTTFQKIPGVAVAALADPDEKGRAEAAGRAGAARTYGDWREMLRVEKPDLVSIGPRWVENRLEMVTAAAEVGASVYTEKPLAASLQEADAMLAVARKAGTRIVLAHQVRMAPVIPHLRKLLDDGLIGDLLELRTRGKEDHRAGGEDLMVLGTHCMYLMRYFAGEPIWCSARVTQDGRDITAADRRAATEPLGPVAGDSIHSTYAFAGGVQGHFASQKIRTGSGGRFHMALHGSKGMVWIHIDPDPKVYYLPDPLWSPGRSGARWEPLPGAPAGRDPAGLEGAEADNKRTVESLIRWIETGEESPVSGEEGLKTLEMIFAVYAAHLAKGRVSFPLEDRRHPLGSL